VHAEALAWVETFCTDEPVSILDIGGRNINGTPRPLFPNATVYTVLDIAPGEGVEIVADAAEWSPDRRYDVVVCCEVFEHTDVWPAILRTAYKALDDGGVLIATMAGPGRAPHSAVDGGPHLYDGEHYGNVEPADLETALAAAGFRDVTVHEQTESHDVRAVAYR
jgi:cyclopropane fatty-acyl-phospholipid synthase-like methyltransferase